ncbi:helix-turn-helix domain-containing protein [Herbiconiux daphne]|uniref:Helix-turn-helix transcriptional regulator n=1 Tax=Herbiconiux daphne TaxID=2970914 RepID=A0ABT2GYG6_9MICO|nr:helix-turn-helix transcriptional regulator [Herbiconiux daphne]MCS5732357.1 helix-turn-helix transcriptional regulator [Herbiconiux daphne]
MTDSRPLLRLAGLDDLSERIYLFIVHRGATSTGDVAERFELERPQALSRLEVLRDLGLLSRGLSDDAHYSPVDPRYSLSAMTDRLSDQITRIRERIPTLGDQFDKIVAPGTDTPETRIVSDTDAVANWYVRLQHQATREFLIFDRPPYVTSRLEPLEAVVLDRGVSWRAVYTAGSFEPEGSWEEANRLASQGEQARIVPALPVKLAIADRATALVSLSLDGVRSDAVVTESQPLISALTDLFEFYWARGRPMPASRDQAEHPASAAGAQSATTTPTATAAAAAMATGTAAGTSPMATPTGSPAELPWRAATREEKAILALIATGMKDESIARQLGMSPRSLRRRSHELMVELGATNRFQAGAEAARRGWV